MEQNEVITWNILTTPPPKIRLYLAMSLMIMSELGGSSVWTCGSTSLGMKRVIGLRHIGHLQGWRADVCCHTRRIHSPDRVSQEMQTSISSAQREQRQIIDATIATAMWLLLPLWFNEVKSQHLQLGRKHMIREVKAKAAIPIFHTEFSTQP